MALVLCLAPAASTVRAQGLLTNGNAHDGGIGAAGEADLWTVTANEGDRIVVQMAELSGGAAFNPRIQLLDPAGTPIATRAGPIAARVNVQAPSTGTYTLRVNDQNLTGTGNYRVWLAQVPGTFSVPVGDEGGALSNGENHQGTIAVGDLDLWTVTATEGDRIALQLSEVTGGAAFTPLIELFAPNGARIAGKSDTLAARLDIQATANGVYTVLISDANESGSGTYRIRLGKVPGAFVVPVGDHGGALTNGQDHQGAIDLGDLDLWTFTAAAGDRIVAQLGEVTGGPSFTPQLELFGPGGARIGIDSDALVARLDFQATSAGTYTLLVSDFSPAGTGTYRLQIANTPGAFVVPASDEGGALADGVNQDAGITVGDLDLWTFSAAAGDLMTLQITELTGGASFTPRFEIFGPSGARTGIAQDTLTATLVRAIETAGTYTILVSDAAQTGAGTYRLNLTRGTIAPAGANVLSNGATQLGSISPASDVDTWTFTASIGETIVIRAGETTAASPLVPWLRLYSPTGVLLDSYSSTVAAEVTVRATNNGTFTVSVADGSNGGLQTGNYRISLAKTGSAPVISPGDEGGPLVNGSSYTSTIDTGDIDAWTFTANAGENLIVRAGEVTTASLFPYLRLYGPDGVQLDEYNGTVASEVAFRATNSGTFLVVMGDGNNGVGGTGNYRISLAKTGSTPVISPGDEGGPSVNGSSYTSTIDMGDIDAWTFTANAGENLIVRAGEVTATSLFPYLRLYGPDGAQLDEYNGTVASEVVFRATNSGTFLVVAGDGNNGLFGIGNYRLSLAKTGSAPVISPGDEGGPLINGSGYTSTIDTGDIDAWTFTANTGESLIVRAGETLAGSPLFPYLRLYGPDGAQLDVYNGTVASEVVFRATNSGTFLVVAGDGNNGIFAAGNYRLSLAKTGSAPVISPGDEGGPMINGTSYTSTIDTGDIDAWTFTANAGENLIVRAGEVTAASPLFPYLRLYGPDGVQLDLYNGTVASEVVFRATNSGTFLVVMGDGNNGIFAAGNYRISLAIMPERFSISGGDDGGSVPANGSALGELSFGDIDMWSFEANKGNSITVRMAELVGPGLTPWLRIYDAQGLLIGESVNVTAAQVTFVAPQSGLYSFVVGDGNNGIGGAGTYELTITGLPEQGKQLRYERPAADSLLINWPAELTGYVLQQTPVLPAVQPAGWQDVQLVPANNGFNVRLTVPIEPTGNRFFRLRQPDP